MQRSVTLSGTYPWSPAVASCGGVEQSSEAAYGEKTQQKCNRVEQSSGPKGLGSFAFRTVVRFRRGTSWQRKGMREKSKD